MVAVVWRKLALKQLKEAYVYVKKDSLKSAISLRKEIFDAIEKLSKIPKSILWINTEQIAMAHLELLRFIAIVLPTK